MKINASFTALEQMVSKMGAESILWDSNAKVLADPRFKERLRAGIEISLSDVSVNPGEPLLYKGEVVLLYIKDTRNEKETLLNSPEKAKRYHVSDCQTLQRMRVQNRFERYVVTNNASGVFKVVALDWRTQKREEIEADLKVCKDCLVSLDYQGYAKENQTGKKRIWSEFQIEIFLNQHSPSFSEVPRYNDNTEPQGGYQDDWAEISKKYRESNNWTCEECGVQLESHKGLLDTHHINGRTEDNNPNNLKALCKICHNKQPMHSNYRVSNGLYHLIVEKRRTQNHRNTRR